MAMACPTGAIAAPTIRTGTNIRITKAVFAMPVLPAFIEIDLEIL
jgi:hypothetical protein